MYEWNEDWEGFIHFQNIHIEDVDVDHLSKIMSVSLTWSQQDDPIGHLIGLFR
jgi:hypothetical protein